MKRIAWRSMSVVAGMTLVAGAMAFAQPEKKADQPADHNAEMEAWQKSAQPGEHHKHIEKFAGEWDAKVSTWMAPGAEPMVSHGVMKNTMVLGGRHLTHEFKGDMMGEAFEGKGSWSYDNNAKRYVGVWMDSMSTGPMVTYGTCDAAGKVFTMIGDTAEPGGKVSKTREVITYKDANSNTMEMFTTGPDGKEFRVMEIVYTRRK